MGKILTCWICICVSICPASQASGDPPFLSARAISLGQAYAGIWGDFGGLYYNPAGIAGVEASQAGIYYERRFMLEELSLGGAGLVLPFAGNQTLGVQLSAFGFAAYRQNQVGIAYAIQLLERISIGAQLHYNLLSIPDYGSHNSFSLDIGVQTRITDDLSLGFSAMNVSRSRLRTQQYEEFQPIVVQAGLAYQPSEELLLVVDVQKDDDHPASFRGGIEYALHKTLKARIGVSTEPLTYTGGLGLMHKGLALDVAFSFTELLGYSPHLSLSYQFGQVKSES